MAPEGTRTLNGEMWVFKKGPFHIAKNTGITIVPIALLGAFKAKRKNDWRLSPGFITTRFGTPISQNEYKDLSVDELSNLIKSKIQALLKGEDWNETIRKIYFFITIY
jgi:1-acyl-sn-glycerol-3-phosphate acyltransferase